MAGIDETKLQAAAEAPKSIRGDQGSMDAHPLQDQIAMDKYLRAKTVQANRGLGLRRIRLSFGSPAE